jgi:predicted metallopeptidase
LIRYIFFKITWPSGIFGVAVMAKYDLGITEIQMVSSLKPAYVIEVLDNLCNSLLCDNRFPN